MHGALLFEKDAESGWLPRVWHLSEVVSAKEQKRLGDNIVPPPFSSASKLERDSEAVEVGAAV